jgi:hypothetical protein
VSALDTPENIVTELERLKAIQAEVEGLFANAEAAELAVPETLRKKIAKVEGKRKGKGAAFDVLAETDTGFADQQDILDVIEYKRDMLDPRIGDAATELIDTEAANKRLESAKRSAKAKGIEFDYYDSVADLPKPILEALGRQGLDTQASRLKGGVFNGRVFVVIQNHNDLVDLEKTLAHELVGHYTVDGMLGAQGLLDLLKRVNKTLGINKLAEKLGLSEQAASTYQSTMSFYNAEIQSGAMSVAEAQEKANVNILRELIAYTMEKRVDASFLEKAKIWIQELIGAVRAWLKSVGFMDSSSFSTNDLFYLMKQARANFAEGKPQIYKTEGDNYIALRGGKAKATPGYSGFGGPNIIAKQSKAAGIAKADGLGLNFRTQLIDQRAAVDAAITRGLDKNLVDATKASDALYFMRMADNRNDLVAKSITMGTVSLVDLKDKKGNVQRTYKSTGTSLADVFKPLKSVKIGNEAFVSDAFSKYLVAYRVITGKLGADVVDIKGRVTDADLRRWLADGERIPEFVEARKLYNQYNKGLIQLNVQAGAMSKELGDKLSKLENYVPLYREVNGNVEMFLGNEQPVRLGDLKNQPYLKELVGGDDLIIDVFASSVRNTQMLTNMALTNMATRNVAFALQQIGIAKIHKGKGSATGNILRYKKDGDDFFAFIDTQAKKDIFGDIPDKLIVQGMEGIQVTLPWVIRALSYPTNLLKKMITRDPRYAVRQVFRESMATYMTAGTDRRHLMSSMTSIGRVLAGKDKTYTDLQRAGVLTGNVTSGTPEEIAKRLEHLAYGRSGWVDKGLAGLDALAMAGEGATKISLFESFIRQGLSERDAYFATLEAANMTRRGLSPSAYYANMLIPFFNAGVQGIDILYRSLSGKMPYDEKLKVQRKLIMRGILMAGITAAYATLMSDDEAYKNAPPEQRYANWFVRIPGVSEPFRIPIPFEVGLLFKAIPEGIWNGLTTEEKGIDIAKDLSSQILRSLPGNLTETGIPIPAGAKPIVELAANMSFFTGRDIVDARMEGVDKAFQYRDKTPELLKVLGPVFQAVNLSPAQAEHLIRGYTGSLGIGILSLSDAVFSSDVVGPVSKRITDVPIAGGLFQPNDAGRVIDDAYENMREINRRADTYKELVKNGRKDEAAAYLKKNATEIERLHGTAGLFRQQMGEITKEERAVKALTEKQMSPEKKREQLDKLRQLKLKLSNDFIKIRERTELQAAR